MILDIPKSISELPRSTIDILLVDYVATKMANDLKISELEKEVRTLTRKLKATIKLTRRKPGSKK